MWTDITHTKSSAWTRPGKTLDQHAKIPQVWPILFDYFISTVKYSNTILCDAELLASEGEITQKICCTEIICGCAGGAKWKSK